MATGLYPDHHGLVNNSFYDRQSQRLYRISDREAVEYGPFYSGEPIWNTAEKQGIKTAIFYWVGSEADVQDMHPTIWKKYDENVTYEARIDSVIQWLSLPEDKRPRLIMFYFDEPDHVGHTYGPFSAETQATVMRVDSMAGLFMRKLKTLPIARQVNFIVTSDHGMGAISDQRKVILWDYVKKSWVSRWNGYSPIITLQPAAGCTDSIYAALKPVKHLSVWKKGEVPEHLHWGKNPRIDELVVLADSAWSIATDMRPVGKGAHGYDPSNTDMHAIFIAKGPDFRRKFNADSFRNIHLYSLMAEILKITPAITDGRIEPVMPMLRRKQHPR
jgi:alkaline phosphatase D